MKENSSIISGLIILCAACVFAGSYKTFHREHLFDCNNDIGLLLCKFKCGIKSFVCYNGKCICIENKMPYDINEDRFSDFDDYTEMTPLQHVIKEDTRPILRHHIAHFCPNLEVARKCIYSCMKSGLPAFCGKDHVCYCGHKYNSPGTAVKINPRDVHAQYIEFYKKYFGPNGQFDETADEELEKGEGDGYSDYKN